jgi:DNA-binding NtrC family response regulator
VVAARAYEICFADLPPLLAPGPARPMERGPLELDSVEKEAILAALHQTGGHQQKAANLLGVSRRTLSRKLKLYDAETEEDSIHVS